MLLNKSNQYSRPHIKLQLILLYLTYSHLLSIAQFYNLQENKQIMKGNSKAETFNVRIRRDQRAKLFDKIRLRFNYDCPSLQEIADNFGLLKKQTAYTIRDILLQRQEALVYAHTWLQQINQKMLDEDQEIVNNQAKLLKNHTDFWSFLVKELFEENIKIDDIVLDFFKDFMQYNQYRLLSNDRTFQIKVINAFELVAYHVCTPKDLKREILKWVTGTQGLVLLSNAMINEFLDPEEYHNFYAVIQLGFQLFDFSQLTTCCQLVIYCFRYADTDDLYYFYESHGEMMVEIINKASMFVKDEDISIFGDAILTLCNSYNSVIFDYTRMGIALLATRMVQSKLNANIEKGLEILNFCAEVEKKEMMEFLTEDLEITEQGLWDILCRTPILFKSNNITIRRYSYSIIANIMAHGEHQQIIFISNNFQIHKDENIMEFMKNTLQLETDNDIISSTLVIINILIYYGNVLKQREQDENMPLAYMYKLGVNSLINKLTKHPNDKINSAALELMEAFHFYENILEIQ